MFLYRIRHYYYYTINDTKAEMIIDDIMKAFGELLNDVTWMDEETRKVAILKVSADKESTSLGQRSVQRLQYEKHVIECIYVHISMTS